MKEKKRLPRYKYSDRSVILLTELFNRRSSHLKVNPDITESEAIMCLIEEDYLIGSSGNEGSNIFQFNEEVRKVITNRLEVILKLECEMTEDLSLYLKNVHRSLWSGILNDAGSFREGKSEWAIVKKDCYSTPSAKKMEEYLIALLEWLKNEKVPAYVRASVSGYALYILQPFTVGNLAISILFERMMLRKLIPAFKELPVANLFYNERNILQMSFMLSIRDGNAMPFIETILELLNNHTEEFKEDYHMIQGKTVLPEKTISVRRKRPELRDENKNERMRAIVDILKDKEMSTREMMEALELKHRPTFRDAYLLPAMAMGLVEMTNPDKPNSSRQKYRIIKAD